MTHPTKVTDVVRRMVGARVSADYCLERRMLRQHVEFAREAQKCYRVADGLLAYIRDNEERQRVIHAIHVDVIGRKRDGIACCGEARDWDSPRP